MHGGYITTVDRRSVGGGSRARQSPRFCLVSASGRRQVVSGRMGDLNNFHFHKYRRSPPSGYQHLQLLLLPLRSSSSGPRGPGRRCTARTGRLAGGGKGLVLAVRDAWGTVRLYYQASWGPSGRPVLNEQPLCVPRGLCGGRLRQAPTARRIGPRLRSTTTLQGPSLLWRSAVGLWR